MKSTFERSDSVGYIETNQGVAVMVQAKEAKSGTIKRAGMLIDDAEIRERFGDKADAIISELDKDRATEINIAMWKGKRFRPAVDAWLEANPQD